MTLKILGSSSAGNCYLLTSSEGTTLIIECGVPFRSIQKALDFDLTKVVGCVVSHEHKDHSREVAKMLGARIPIYTSAGTASALGIGDDPMIQAVEGGKLYHLDSFDVLPFRVQHDASEPLGFLISHPEMGTTLFATDTYYLKYRFQGLSNVLIECNYSREILDRNVQLGYVSQAQRDRVLRSHMSYEQCIATLQQSDISRVNNIILIHLSDSNSHAEDFRRGVAEATGKTTHIAQSGMVLEFNRTPF